VVPQSIPRDWRLRCAPGALTGHREADPGEAKRAKTVVLVVSSRCRDRSRRSRRPSSPQRSSRWRPRVRVTRCRCRRTLSRRCRSRSLRDWRSPCRCQCPHDHVRLAESPTVSVCSPGRQSGGDYCGSRATALGQPAQSITATVVFAARPRHADAVTTTGVNASVLVPFPELAEVVLAPAPHGAVRKGAHSCARHPMQRRSGGDSGDGRGRIVEIVPGAVPLPSWPKFCRPTAHRASRKSAQLWLARVRGGRAIPPTVTGRRSWGGPVAELAFTVPPQQRTRRPGGARRYGRSRLRRRRPW